MRISVIFVSYNTAQMSLQALADLFASKGGFDLQVIVVDNASKDNSVELIKNAYPNITLIENKVNVGFGRANNQAIEIADGNYILLLNTDAFVKPDTLLKTIEYMNTHPECGLLGARLLGRDQEQQPSCRYFPTPLNLFAGRVGLNRVIPSIQLVDDPNWDPDLTAKCDWVPGCYYLLRKKVVEEVGVFDPLYFLYSEEVDHCFAIKKAGWEVVYFADAPVVHIGGESAKSVSEISTVSRQVPHLQIESELLYFRKNHGVISVLTHLFMSNLADAIQLGKDIVCARGISKVIYSFKRIFSYWRLFFMTKFATKSIR
jgi:N-acetylglucosaminyl-diphospho-decaprenol L-rhamnosyltransferase